MTSRKTLEHPVIDGPRACSHSDLPDVISLVDSALGRLGTGQSLLTDYPLVYDKQNLENVRIVRVKGELASVVPFIGWTATLEDCKWRVGIISPTATAVAHRKKGYGRLCLGDSIRKMGEDRCVVSVLWTDRETFPFYEKEDYQNVRNQTWIYTCRREHSPFFLDNGETVSVHDPSRCGDLASVQGIHDKEQFRFERSASQYKVLLNLPRMRTLIASRNATPTAYAVVSTAINKPGLLEAGGEESGLETLMHKVLSEGTEAGALDVHVNGTASAIGNLFARKAPGPPRPRSDSDEQMMRINDPRSLFDQLSRRLERRNRGLVRSFSIEVSGDTIGFEFTGDRLRLGRAKFGDHTMLTRREVTSVVFGPPPPVPERQILPFEAYNGMPVSGLALGSKLGLIPANR